MSSQPSIKSTRAFSRTALGCAIESFAQVEAIASSIEALAIDGINKSGPMSPCARFMQMQHLASAVRYLASEAGNLSDCQREDLA